MAAQAARSVVRTHRVLSSRGFSSKAVGAGFTADNNCVSWFVSGSINPNLDSGHGLVVREHAVLSADKFGMTKDQAGALFDKVDTNGDGVITPKDWADYMWEKINDKDPRTRPEVKISPPMERLTAKGLRADNRAYSSVQPGRFSDPVHRGCGWFVSGVVNPKLDISQNGLVQKAEVMAAAEKFGMTVEFAAELFDRIDANGDGSITPKEWADYMWEQTISEVHLR